MVRNYKRKTTDKWSKEDLLEALICIKTGEKKIGECTQQYKISRATLYRHFQKMMLDTRNYVSVFAFQKCGGKPILTRVEEEVLETTVKELMDKGFTVTSSDIKRICYEYCFTNGIPNRFSEVRRMASDDWYYGFLKRRPNLGVLLSKTKGNSTSERETRSDEQCGAKEGKAKEGEEKSQDAHKNLEMHKNASDEDACPPDAPVLKKPLKRLFETEKQKKRRKKATRPPPAAVRRQRQNVRKGGRTNLAKSLSDDDEFFDFEAMEVKEEKDDGTDEHEESENDEDDNTDEHEQETETTISGSEDGSDSDFNKVDIVTEEGEGSTKKHDEKNQESGESEQDNDQVLGSEEEEDECAEEDTKEEKRECEGDSNESGLEEEELECEGDSNESGLEEEEQECEGDSNVSGIEEEEEESESDFDDDPEGEEENETSNGDESNAEDEGDKEE
ncbi:unnamed protein product [Orchesella dallaii]|uniref:HTH psq-type domain-containing protein n=1 Tax=Orchesella dallaii TaxID=48710 RepID=A0ABP1QBH6_9HEXA